MTQLYDLRAQAHLIAKMQETSLTRQDIGLAPDPLVGSPEWWDAVERGRLRRYDLSGVIAREWWAGMADWPEFELRQDAGALTTWTREGDARRFAPELRARVYTSSTRGNPTPYRGEMSKLVLGLWVEDSASRVPAFAPGPGGAGYRLSRQKGEAAHFLYVSDRSRAVELLSALQASGRTGRLWGGGTPSLWIVQIWAGQASDAKAESPNLHEIAQRYGGRYDGGEIIEGEIWGPLPV